MCGGKVVKFCVGCGEEKDVCWLLVEIYCIFFVIDLVCLVGENMYFRV